VVVVPAAIAATNCEGVAPNYQVVVPNTIPQLTLRRPLCDAVFGPTAWKTPQIAVIFEASVWERLHATARLFSINRAGGDRGAWLRFPFKAAKSGLFAFCGSVEACLEVGNFELGQSTQRLARSKPGEDSYLAVAAGRAF
jgi:hypothetical protein